MEASHLPKDIITSIKLHAHREFPKEACGVVIVYKGKPKYVECTNISSIEDHFIINPVQYAALSDKTYLIVHSHTTGNEPSEHDISCLNTLRVPYLIYYIESDTYGVYYPKNYNKLIGREYVFGEQDCFEAARDWYLAHDIIVPPRRKWVDNWWEHHYNYIKDDISQWPLKQVDNPEYGDILTFKVDSSIENHLGVYLGDDMFYHHAVNRMSCVENIYPFWAEFLESIYRYDGASITRRSWR